MGWLCRFALRVVGPGSGRLKGGGSGSSGGGRWLTA